MHTHHWLHRGPECSRVKLVLHPQLKLRRTFGKISREFPAFSKLPLLVWKADFFSEASHGSWLPVCFFIRTDDECDDRWSWSMGEAGPGDAVDTEEMPPATRGRSCLALWTGARLGSLQAPSSCATGLLLDPQQTPSPLCLPASLLMSLSHPVVLWATWDTLGPYQVPESSALAGACWFAGERVGGPGSRQRRGEAASLSAWCTSAQGSQLGGALPCSQAGGKANIWSRALPLPVGREEMVRRVHCARPPHWSPA